MARRKTSFAVVRDVVNWALGIGIIVFQVITDRVRFELLFVALSLMAIPGAIGLLNLRSSTSHSTGAESQSSSHSSSSSQSS